MIPQYDEVKVLQEQEGWVKVRYDDKIGYVCGDYLQDGSLEYLGNYFITAYEDTGLLCANGAYPTVGYTVAHNTFPFGTEVYIDGVGCRTVEDRGPSYLGSEWLDLYLGDSSECYVWGEQHRDVYLVNHNEEEDKK